MKKIFLILSLIACSLLLNSITQADVLYHELWAGQSGEIFFDTYGWFYYRHYQPSGGIYTEDGTDPWGGNYMGWSVGGIGTGGGWGVEIGSVNSNPLVADAANTGNVFYGGGSNDDTLFYTNEYVIDLNDWAFFTFSFYEANDATGEEYRAAVGISSTPDGDPNWYVSDPVVTSNCPGAGNWAQGRLVIDTAMANWAALNMTNLSPGTPNQSLPVTGYIVAFGMYIQDQTGNMRFDNFMLEGVWTGPLNTLTIQVSPSDQGITSVIPSLGAHEYSPNAVVGLVAPSQAICPDTWEFDHWEGDVASPAETTTTVTMNTSKTVTAVYVATRQCGDACHEPPAMDFSNPPDCVVNLEDFSLFASAWLECTSPECD